MTPRERLHFLLREIGRDTGFTQAEAPKRIGKPQSFVSKYGRGARRLDLLALRQMCEAVGVRSEGFVMRREEPMA